jgi:ribose transport system ATP-binding protein
MSNNGLTQAAQELTATGVSKRFGGVQALDRAELSVLGGEVHAILGENGAGKSTLVKIIAGVVPLDTGEVRAGGRALGLGSPQGARDAGIAVVYQELSLVPQLSVAHNLLLTRLPKRYKLISMKEVNETAEGVLANLGLNDIDPRAPVAELPLDKQQMIEIAKATMVRPRILILDEATSSLGSAEVDRLFDLVRGLRNLGTTVVLITHRMREVWALADTMTILRDGRTVGRSAVGEISPAEAVSLMAGRDVKTIFPEKPSLGEAATAIELRDVRLRPERPPWSLKIRKGEILGLGGLEGQGQRELLTWMYGSGQGSGSMFREDVPLRVRNPAEALRHGIVLIPEDRKAEGLHLELPVRWNLAMATLPQRSRLGVIQMGAEKAFADQKIEELRIRLGSPFQPASALSGGTQQKVVLGKFMARQPSLLLFVDPTRGIDVQTKFGVYETLRGLARSGASCVVYSSDTEELVGLCDRVAVFHDAAPVAVLEGEEITQDAVVAASFAVAREASS